MARVLYGYWRSSASYRCRIALALKGLDYESRPIDLRAGEQMDEAYRRLNPQGLVPFLIDGETRIGQSLAILEYLEERYPDPPLLPIGMAERAHARSIAATITCDIHPLNNLRVLKTLKRMGHGQAAIDDWARNWIAEGFAALEAVVSGPFMAGEQITVADVCFVPQVYNARRVEADLTPYPRLVAIDARLGAHPAFAAALPERQSDAP